MTQRRPQMNHHLAAETITLHTKSTKQSFVVLWVHKNQIIKSGLSDKIALARGQLENAASALSSSLGPPFYIHWQGLCVKLIKKCVKNASHT